MRGPKHLGQRRYRLAHNKSDGSPGGEPGYIRSVYESSRPRSWGDWPRMLIVEEVAVADQSGKLHWLDSDVIPATRYNTWFSVGEGRDLCDRLNKAPLGASLVSKVDEESGWLVIQKVRRRYSFARGDQPEVLEEVEKGSSFDVDDPAQAKKAKEFYQSLKEDVDQENELAAEGLLKKLRSEGNEKARSLYPSQEVADRSRAAEEFADALSKGKAAEIIKEQEAVEEKQEAEQEKKRSARAKQTIDALSQT